MLRPEIIIPPLLDMYVRVCLSDAVPSNAASWDHHTPAAWHVRVCLYVRMTSHSVHWCSVFTDGWMVWSMYLCCIVTSCHWLALLSFKRPLLSVCVSVLLLNISETKPFRASLPIWKCLQGVDWWRHRWRHVTSTSHSWRHSLHSRHIRKLGSGSTTCVVALSKHEHGVKSRARSDYNCDFTSAKIRHFSWRNLTIQTIKPSSTIRVDPLSIHYCRTLC